MSHTGSPQQRKNTWFWYSYLESKDPCEDLTELDALVVFREHLGCNSVGELPSPTCAVPLCVAKWDWKNWKIEA